MRLFWAGYHHGVPVFIRKHSNSNGAYNRSYLAQILRDANTLPENIADGWTYKEIPETCVKKLVPNHNFDNVIDVKWPKQ